MDLVKPVCNSDINFMDILGTDRGSNQKETLKETFSRLIQVKKEEFITRIQNGSSEQSIQIGACSYTETEWNKLLKDFDAAEEQLREEAAKTENEQYASGVVNSEKDDKNKEENVEMLLADYTIAAFKSDDKDTADDVYYNYYTTDGIYCRKQGKQEFEWQIPLRDNMQYEKVMSFLQGFDTNDNMNFACNENFWSDFLAD